MNAIIKDIQINLLDNSILDIYLNITDLKGNIIKSPILNIKTQDANADSTIDNLVNNYLASLTETIVTQASYSNLIGKTYSLDQSTIPSAKVDNLKASSI